jgi:hypothetical protein
MSCVCGHSPKEHGHEPIHAGPCEEQPESRCTACECAGYSPDEEERDENKPRGLLGMRCIKCAAPLRVTCPKGCEQHYSLPADVFSAHENGELEERGFVRITPFCSAGRRALWMRHYGKRVELRAGREGDDGVVDFVEGMALDAKMLRAIVSLLETVRFACET